MEARTFETRTTERRSYFPWISWGAIFAGLASGMGTYLLLALLGLAAGLTAVDPQSADPMGKAPLITGIWTSISLVLAAFIGGYVAARMSGLTRLADGMLHGLVAWSVSTLVFAFVITTSIGSIIGGAFSMIGQGAKAVAGGAASTAGNVSGSPGIQNQLESLLKGSSGQGNVSKESMSSLQEKLSAGDRDGAISVMTNEMGFTRDRAETVVDRGMALSGSAQNLPEQARGAASSAVSGLTKISWGLFIGVLLSMALGVFGGVVGSKAAVKRRSPMLHSA